MQVQEVRRFVNKLVVHRAHPVRIRNPLKYHEIDDALEMLDKILCKYNLLLTAAGLQTTRATRQYNWKSVLHQAWIKSEDD